MQRVYSEGAPEVLDRNEITIAILAPSAEDSHTNVTLQTRSPDVANWATLFFANGTQDGASANVQLMRGPAASTMPTAQVPQRILPYASEAFGVYQPLIGWRSTLTNKRLADATANRFRAAKGVSGRLASAAQNPANLATGVGKPTDRTQTAVGAAFAALLGTTPIIATAGGEQAALLDGWIETTSLIAGVVAPPAPARRLAGARIPRNVPHHRSRRPRSHQRPQTTWLQAVLLRYLGQAAPAAVSQLFVPTLTASDRLVACLAWFNEKHPAKMAFLSPIGILHRFRGCFFELGSFLGPPVGHVWLSPGGTVELIETSTRRQLTENSVEQDPIDK